MEEKAILLRQSYGGALQVQGEVQGQGAPTVRPGPWRKLYGQHHAKERMLDGGLAEALNVLERLVPEVRVVELGVVTGLG